MCGIAAAGPHPRQITQSPVAEQHVLRRPTTKPASSWIAKNGRKLAKSGILPVFNRFFLPKRGQILSDLNLDQISNPRIKAHLLDHKMKGN